MIEYELLKIIWWVLVCVLLIGFALTDGFDMGISWLLSSLLEKPDSERRAAINTIPPHWDGNQVWFITAGGALFACMANGLLSRFLRHVLGTIVSSICTFLRPVGFRLLSL